MFTKAMVNGSLVPFTVSKYRKYVPKNYNKLRGVVKRVFGSSDANSIFSRATGQQRARLQYRLVFRADENGDGEDCVTFRLKSESPVITSRKMYAKSPSLRRYTRWAHSWIPLHAYLGTPILKFPFNFCMDQNLEWNPNVSILQYNIFAWYIRRIKYFGIQYSIMNYIYILYYIYYPRIY